MNIILTALALTIAFPAVAAAQPANAGPAAKPCDKATPGCKDGKVDHSAHTNHNAHGAKAGADPHAGHVMDKAPAASAPAEAPAAEGHHDHQH